jgi:uncharacterized protein (TIGR04255 family)
MSRNAQDSHGRASPRSDSDHKILRDQASVVTLDLVRFPDSPRVIYARNPLVEVICQLRFARLLKIESELPVAFQEALRHDYPKLREVKSAGLPDPVANAIGIQPNVITSTFEFVDRDDIWKVSLTSTFLAISTVQYTRWEDFLARLRSVLDVLATVYGVSRFTRVGLRYRDLISPSQVGMKNQQWGKFVRPELLGELVDRDFEFAVKHASRQLVLSLDYDRASVRLSHGILKAEDEDANVESCYLIDADFYTEHETERADAENCLARFNGESGRLFRWCITRTLHDAMGPVEPRSAVDERGLDPG